MLVWVGYRRTHVELTLSLPYRLYMSLNWFINSPNLVFYSQLYLVLGVFIRYCYKNCIILYMLLIFIHIKPSLHYSCMCGGLSQLSRLGSLQLITQFVYTIKILVSFNRVSYSHYLCLHENLSNEPWVSLQIFWWFWVRIAYLYMLIRLVSSVNLLFTFLWGRESLVLSIQHYSFFGYVCDYLGYLPIYSIIEILVSLHSPGRVYGRYLVPSVSYSSPYDPQTDGQTDGWTERQNRTTEYIIHCWYVRVVQTGCMLFL